MDAILVSLDGPRLRFRRDRDADDHFGSGQVNPLGGSSVDDAAPPPVRDRAIAFPRHDGRGGNPKSRRHRTDAAEPIEDRNVQRGLVTVHIPHISHVSDVCQSHFVRAPENSNVPPVNHREILNALRELDLSQERIGDVIRRDRSAVSRLLSGRRAMKASEVEPLTRLIEETRLARNNAPRPAALPRPVEVLPAPDPYVTGHLPRDVPVYGTALGGEMHLGDKSQAMGIEQTILEMTEAIDFVRRPPVFSNLRGVYAVYVAGSSMEPRYDAGDLLYVDPRRPAGVGDDVIVQLRDGNGHDGSEQVVAALIKRLVRRTSDGIELEQYNPPRRFILPASQVASVHRVVRISEVLGT